MDKITLSKKKTITLKRTSTERSDYSGSESSPLLDKRVRNTKYKENEGEVQEVFEEVSPAQELEMTDKMSEKLDEILEKLNKLDSIESTLNNLCLKMAIVEGDISKLKTDLARGTDTKLQQMNEGLKWFNKEMEDL